MSKVVILTLAGCPGCEKLIKELSKDTEVCEIHDETCKTIMEKAGADKLPQPITIEDGVIIKCKLAEKDGKNIAICNGVEHDI